MGELEHGLEIKVNVGTPGRIRFCLIACWFCPLPRVAVWATVLGCVADAVEVRRDEMDGVGKEGKRKESSKSAECRATAVGCSEAPECLLQR